MITYILLGAVIALVAYPIFSYFVEILSVLKDYVVTRVSVPIAKMAEEISKMQHSEGDASLIGFNIDPDEYMEDEEYD